MKGKYQYYKATMKDDYELLFYIHSFDNSWVKVYDSERKKLCAITMTTEETKSYSSIKKIANKVYKYFKQEYRPDFPKSKVMEIEKIESFPSEFDNT